VKSFCFFVLVLLATCLFLGRTDCFEVFDSASVRLVSTCLPTLLSESALVTDVVDLWTLQSSEDSVARLPRLGAACAVLQNVCYHCSVS